jgi:hypothetical protein
MASAARSLWYRRSKFADVRILLVEALDPGSDMEQIIDVVPAHRLVLYEQSTFFQAKVSLTCWRHTGHTMMVYRVLCGFAGSVEPCAMHEAAISSA